MGRLGKLNQILIMMCPLQYQQSVADYKQKWYALSKCIYITYCYSLQDMFVTQWEMAA